MSAPFSRRTFLQLSGMAAGATALAACGSGGGGKGSTSGGVTTFWNGFQDTQTQDYFKTHFIDAYNASNQPKIEMTIKPIDTLSQLLKTAIAAGHGPDIIQEDGPALALAYYNAGDLLPLDDYIAKYNWNTKLIPWSLETGKINGKVYSVPSSYETMALFYSPETFQENSWTVPTNRDEFEAVCEEAAGKKIMPLAVGAADWHATSEWFVTIFLNAFSGPQAVYEALQGKIKWSDPVLVDAITLLNDYFQKGWFGGGVQNYFTNKRAALDTKLASGKAAMDLSGSWVVAEYQPYFGKNGQNRTWDWAAIPQFSNGAPANVFDLSVGQTFSINKRAKQPDGAAAWLNWWLSDTKAQGEALAAAGQEPFPVHLSASDFPATGGDPRSERMYQQLGSAKTIGYTTWTFLPPKSDTYVYTAFDKVITGKLTPKAYMDGLDAIFASELKQGLVPPLPAPNQA
jgi:raffinose/stachyose/melibiose transport system substrate-binding protein